VAIPPAGEGAAGARPASPPGATQGGGAERSVPTSIALAGVAVEVAEAAGLVLRAGVGRARLGVETKSSDTDMVTDVDRASEALVARLLAARRPDDGLLGEEGATRPSSSGVTWVVDPLDGTTNYLYGLHPSGVSVAAATAHGVLAGAVHDPWRAETFWAAAGRGAWLDTTPLRRRGGPALAEALLGTGFAYDARRRAAQAAALRTVLPAVRDIRRAGAAAVDLCWVAAGRLDGFYEAGLQPWDHAAALLVVREAGARAEELPGRDGYLPTVVAAAPGLFDPLVALLERAGAHKVPAVSPRRPRRPRGPARDQRS